ncbi:50S ribosomal protein L3 [Candidatus Bathyarchaeota archaeon]|nr:50S ribosomal protein L3 [Candidatus Bathyarchaeota archaeon]NIR14030.1 50S ribosomal protein L3 [Desulfobacterales bacterium]NIU80657.1 50S ribosomal protein L3 [Candidatus Bathyarchaeota archaeon]NIV67278.1 50S ribosomal protein L3 [Candidatus Bathyarchaeota archaeon]NIW15843.1 50S ribosomal protein L3 [Candidatus Bathyarchaeota archaeon]
MGHRKKHAPRRGSLAYLPRGRAARPVPRIRHWPEAEEGPILLGFTGYKAGMTHIFYVEDREGSPQFGKEVIHSATVLDVPPVTVCALKAYVRGQSGLQTFTEAWMKEPPKDLNRVLTLPENPDPEKALEKMEENLDRITEFRLLVATQPRLASGVPKKKPELMEIKVGGGSIPEQFEYSKKQLGKILSVINVFKEGQFVDVLSITKGKGFQGPVKRWGVKILPPKSRKTKRGVAVIGPWHPARVVYSVPRPGQTGYFQRTEYNKRVLKIGADGKEITPQGGFKRYGPVRGMYLLVDGSLPGPPKRLVRLRYPARPPTKIPESPPNITYISLESPQG